ncbi:hypothetical protein LCGC14_2736440, partial [marine sediment metagenome]
GNRTIVIHPGSGGRRKCWYPDNFIAIAEVLSQNNSVIFLLGPAETEGFDLLILDIMMPKRSGLDVLRELRSRGVATPVLLLTARGSVSDKVAGLDLGADDYLTKPFALAELLARIRALSRRRDAIEDPVLTCGDLELDLKSRQVSRAGKEIVLTAKEFALLRYLLSHQGTVVTRTEIMEKVWDVHLDAFSDVVKVMISRLRRKVDAEGAPSLIRTVRGVGYMIGKA